MDKAKEQFKIIKKHSRAKNYLQKAYQMANESNHILPILSYQSTVCMWMQKREAPENIFSKKFYRTV